MDYWKNFASTLFTSEISCNHDKRTLQICGLYMHVFPFGPWTYQREKRQRYGAALNVRRGALFKHGAQREEVCLVALLIVEWQFNLGCKSNALVAKEDN